VSSIEAPGSPAPGPAAPREARFPRWLVAATFAGALAITAVSAVTFMLRNQAAEAAEVERLLTRLETQAQTINAIEWEMAASPRPGPALFNRLMAVHDRLEHTIAQLEERADDEAQIRDVIGAYRKHEGDLQEQLRLIEKGDFGAAASIDRQVVDPALGDFVEMTRSAALEQSESASNANRLAFFATNALIIALVASGLGFVIGSQRHRTRLAVERAERETLARMADIDPLTGLFNRRRFEAEMSRALEAKADGSVLFLDIDHFKTVNDTFGHGAGDRLLCLIADAIRASVRPGDVVARIGGDEFAVLILVGDEAVSAEIASRILAAVKERASSFASATSSPTASIGLASFRRGAGSVAALIALADEAMYRAKRTGNRYADADRAA
jgi:diguanylate cyclase (GGDEF)-like protein